MRMAGISNDASLRGKVRAVAKKNGLRAQEVLQMYLNYQIGRASCRERV